MEQEKRLYSSYLNPLFITPKRPLPKEVAVIGAGTIGPDIGYYLKTALPGIKLYLVDVADEPLANAEKRISGYVQKAVARKKMKEDAGQAVLENIVYTQDYNTLKDCDLIIEAATENIPLKQKIFETLEGIVREDAIITSNTSSIPANRIFSHMKHPERTTVTHFFAPAWRSLPVEVIAWEKGSPDVLNDLFWLFAKTGKAPIITDDAICFVLDRIFDNWCNEAAFLLNAATASQIDKVAEEFVAAGPFFVLNMANGNPIIMETNTLQMEEGAHYRPAGILGSVDRWSTHRPGSPVEVPDALRETIRDRLLGILFSQSFDIVDRGIGTKADLNFGCMIALGFKKGPFDIMKDLGESEVRRVMDVFEAERPGFPRAIDPFPAYQDFYRNILVDEMDGVKIITLRRPQAMNALSGDCTAEIRSVLERDASNPAVKGFVITGYGNASFSAGADIGKSFPELLGDKEAAYQFAKGAGELQLFMDRMEKPVVAAVNGMALGGGLETATRCHRIVATKNLMFQFPEVNLGILPGVGGCVVPYRKWPKGASLFHEMICLAKPIFAKQAAEIGMVDKLVDDYSELIPAAVEEVKALEGKIERMPSEKVAIPEVTLPEQPMAGKLPLSKEVVSIIAETIRLGAAADSFEEALDIGYHGFSDTACTDAAKEGVWAFIQKRRPDFKK